MKTHVTLTHFNRSGVAVGFDSFETEKVTMESVIYQVSVMRDDGKLSELPGAGEDSYILVIVEAPWCYPHLILPPFLKQAVREHWTRLQADLPG